MRCAIASPLTRTLWRLNWSIFAPRDGQGLLSAERVADIMAEKLKTEYPYADGVEFDVGDWEGRAYTSNEKRGVDCDNDLDYFCVLSHGALGQEVQHPAGHRAQRTLIPRAIRPVRTSTTTVLSRVRQSACWVVSLARSWLCNRARCAGSRPW